MAEAFASARAAPRHREALIVLIGSLLYVIGIGEPDVMPSYLSASAAQLHLGARAIGTLSGAELFGIALGCLGASLMGRRASALFWASVALACVLGDLLTAKIGSFQLLLAVRFLTALLGEGPCFAGSLLILGMARSPERAVGIAISSAAVVSAATLAVGRPLIAVVGPTGLFLPLMAASVLVVLVIRWLLVAEAADVPAGDRASLSRSACRKLVGICLWYAAPSMFWAFISLWGEARAIPDNIIDETLAVATLMGFVGSLIPIMLRDCLGRIVPIGAATLGLVLSAVLYARTDAAWQIGLWISMVNICWNLGAVYQIAMLAKIDRTGRTAGLGGVAQLMGQGLGPATGGMMIEAFGYGAVPFGMAALALAGFLLLAGFARFRFNGRTQTA